MEGDGGGEEEEDVVSLTCGLISISLRFFPFFLSFFCLAMTGGKGRRLHLFTIHCFFSEKQGQFCGLGDKNQKNMGRFVYYYQYGIIYGIKKFKLGILML